MPSASHSRSRRRARGSSAAGAKPTVGEAQRLRLLDQPRLQIVESCGVRPHSRLAPVNPTPGKPRAWPGAATGGTGPLAIEARGLVKRFDGALAVDGVDLAVPEGAIYGMLGPNGAGKTTTLRMLLGIIEPDSGERRVLGHANPQHIARAIGYLPEERGLYPVDEGLRGDRLHGRAARAAARRRAQARARAARSQRPRLRADRQIRQLSKGMAQQVQLLGTLVHEPRLVIFDEPFSGLDAINQGKLERLIRDLAAKGTTVIFSTHVIAHAERLCDSVAIIAGGKVPYAGSVDAARDRIRPQVRLETRHRDGPWRAALPADARREGSFWHFPLPESGVEPLLRALIEGDAGILSLSIERAGLHDAFVAIAGEAAAKALEAEAGAGAMSAERLPLLKAAYVIARRDFVAILFSRAFFFFLLGPLFPLAVGALAGGIGAARRQRRGQPADRHRHGSAPTSSDARRAAAACGRSSVGASRKWSCCDRLGPGESYDARAVLERREGSFAAVLGGTPAAPVLTAQPDRLQCVERPGRADRRRSSRHRRAPIPRSATQAVATSGASEQQRAAAHRAGRATAAVPADHAARRHGAVEPGRGEGQQGHRDPRRGDPDGRGVPRQAVRHARDLAGRHCGVDHADRRADRLVGHRGRVRRDDRLVEPAQPGRRAGLRSCCSGWSISR